MHQSIAQIGKQTKIIILFEYFLMGLTSLIIVGVFFTIMGAFGDHAFLRINGGAQIVPLMQVFFGQLLFTQTTIFGFDPGNAIKQLRFKQGKNRRVDGFQFLKNGAQALFGIGRIVGALKERSFF